MREAAQRLIKQSQQMIDKTHVLLREGEAAPFAAQQASMKSG